MLDLKKFQRKKENFVCTNCGFFVVGDGYTNHCPQCLWSKHVDINPGDRQQPCHGLMEPVGVCIKNGKLMIVHRCTACGFFTKNKISKNDNWDVILEYVRKPLKLPKQ